MALRPCSIDTIIDSRKKAPGQTPPPPTITPPVSRRKLPNKIPPDKTPTHDPPTTIHLPTTTSRPSTTTQPRRNPLNNFPHQRLQTNAPPKQTPLMTSPPPQLTNQSNHGNTNRQCTPPPRQTSDKTVDNHLPPNKMLLTDQLSPHRQPLSRQKPLEKLPLHLQTSPPQQAP